MRRLSLAAACLCAAVLSASRAEATVIYSTDVDSVFHIAATGVELGLPFDGSFFVTGNGSAGYAGSATSDGVFPVEKHVGVSGSAFAPPNSFATSTFMSGHIIEIDNLGSPPPDDTSPIVVPFVFTYSWDIDLSRDFPGLEFASAGAFFHITGIDNEALFIDTVGGMPGPGFVPEYLHHIMNTTLFGGTGSSGMVVVTGAIHVPAETLSLFSVITDTTGMAVAVTPEPSSLMLLGLGVCGLVGLRRRTS
jgi:hypothetical protein